MQLQSNRRQTRNWKSCGLGWIWNNQ